MASDAKAILSHPRSDANLSLVAAIDWLRQNGSLTLICVGAFLYAWTLLSGLHLFDNDYDWINSGQDQSVLSILWEILRPIPEQWGFQDRPVQTLSFKLLFGAFGYSAGAYYAFKAALFASVCFGIARLSATLGLSERTGLLAAALFALSTSGHASALWVSDFELLAEILTMASFGAFWHLLSTQDNTRRAEILNQALFVLISVVAHRTKGSAKLIPAIIFLYLVLYRRDQIRRFIPAIALISLTIVPVFAVLENPVLPFAPFAKDQSQGWMWKPANRGTLSTLVLGNFHPFYGTSGPDIAYSILSVVTPALLWPGLLVVGILCAKHRNSFSRPALAFTCIWAAIAIGSYASFPRLPEGFMARYVVVGLIPISILFGMVFSQIT